MDLPLAIHGGQYYNNITFQKQAFPAVGANAIRKKFP
jgi:hypothetical protein